MATDYARQAIFTQADVLFASILGRKFHPLTALDIIRSISDLEIIEHPYDAINVAKVHERLQKYGYDANEIQDVIWALRERAAGLGVPKLLVQVGG
jgi:hypothetical protein